MTDQEYIKEYQSNGDLKSITVLYKKYLSFVLGVSMKYLKNETEAEDATMEVFEILIHNLKKNTPEFFKSYLFAITRNHCLATIRKKAKSIELEKDLYSNFMDFEEEDTLIYEKLDVLNELLHQLPEEQKKAIKMFYFDNMSYQNICEVQKWTYNEVKSHLQNGKRNLLILFNKAWIKI